MDSHNPTTKANGSDHRDTEDTESGALSVSSVPPWLQPLTL